MANRTRVFTRRPDGSIDYVTAADGDIQSGSLSPGSEGGSLSETGYHELAPEGFDAYKQAVTPLRSPESRAGNAFRALVDGSVDAGPRPLRTPSGDMASLPVGASRVFHRAIDGTIPYFRNEGSMQEEGRLPDGADPAELLSQGYVEADRDSFLEARTRLDPLRSVPQQAREVNVPGGGKLRMPPVDAEDEALKELGASMDYAGLGKPAPVPAPAIGAGTGNRARPSRPARPRGDSPADVDALGAEWDDFYGRAQEVDVQNVPSAVPLASRMSGTPLPGPTQRNAVASPEPGLQQGPVFGEADTLRDAQKRAALMRGLAGAGKGMSRIGAAIAGVRPDDGAASDMERGADSQVRDYLQRKQQADADKASALKAAEQDPTSPASKRFQAMVSSAFGSVYTPEQIASMTAADAPLVGKYGEMVRTLEDRAAGRAAEQESQQAQLTARATEAEKQRAFEGKQSAANRANAREIAGMRQEQAGDKVQEAFDRKISERNVSGYAFDPARPPSAEGAKNMAAAVKARSEIEASLNRLESDISEHGSEMFGAKAGEMASEWMNVTNKLRMLNDMGVPNGADYLMLGKQISDPTSGAAATTSNARLLQQIKTLRSQIGRTVDATANAYGFRPATGPQRVGMQGNMDLGDEDRQALEWARANPTDPRAKQILSMNGG
jgi:hypothetical protein